MDSSDFSRVTFQKEIDGLASELQTKVVDISIFSDDGRHGAYKIVQGTGGIVLASLVKTPGQAAPAFGPGQSVHILFSSSEGLFSVTSSIVSCTPNDVTVKLSQEYYRMQRRHNFRTLVPPGLQVNLLVHAVGGAKMSDQRALKILDVSAGGLRVLWPTNYLPTPAIGDAVTGQLRLPPDKNFLVHLSVRSLASESDGLKFGLEFEQLAQSEEQALLFTCLQIRRRQIF